jgi:hypothetical protein
MTRTAIDDLVGLTFHHIEGKVEDDVLLFVGVGDIPTFKFYHEQDCCESVSIAEIHGDLEDLVGVPILEAREDMQEGVVGDFESATWTFYNFRTIKGSVTVRWLGISNGYYSERVSIERLTTEYEEIVKDVENEN